MMMNGPRQHLASFPGSSPAVCRILYKKLGGYKARQHLVQASSTVSRHFGAETKPTFKTSFESSLHADNNGTIPSFISHSHTKIQCLDSDYTASLVDM